ncbi:Serine/threonine-protein kinase Nek8 [Hondaea fermentalgiana]|uniref:Serine/threonine-protein kinase Nek8 n=1 Tax=Hondaea fermentalgiana TaxID=2315210 RepID=A0A2R5GAG6_9STRA|nr:Serine/threonine-protein kinase Nek8 [Hondaea fermentalgiana]|eukprot:GBG25543.1 Serine/threonine-protein kinase Nek8 [Hondaea fermentalgiana]
MATSVYSWGTGDDGQLAQPSIEKSGMMNTYRESAPRLVEALEGQDVESVACGPSHAAATTKDGRVLTWGKAEAEGGVLGLFSMGASTPLLGHAGGDGKHCLFPHWVSEGLEGVRAKQVSCGANHTGVLSDKGDVFTWGAGGSMGSASALGLGSSDAASRPEQVLFGDSDEVKIAQIASGSKHMVALGVDGEVWTWGSGENGRLGNGGTTDQLEPYPVEYFLEVGIKIVSIATGNSFSLALSDDGKVYGWGKNDQAQLGLGGSMSMDVYAMEEMPRQIDLLANETIVSIAAGGSHAMAVNSKGEVFHWGMRLWVEPHKMTALQQHHVVQAGCGANFNAVLTDIGQVFTWGKGRTGALGHGDNSRYAQPTLVEGLVARDVTQIACGPNYTLAVAK